MRSFRNLFRPEAARRRIDLQPTAAGLFAGEGEMARALLAILIVGITTLLVATGGLSFAVWILLRAL